MMTTTSSMVSNLLEPDEAKASSPVLRGEGASNGPDLPDYPEEWQLAEVFHKAPRDEDGSPILPESITRAQMFRGVKFLREPESVGYEVARWLRIADEVELRFKH